MQNALNKVQHSMSEQHKYQAIIMALTLSGNSLVCPSLVPSVLCIGEEYNISISSEFKSYTTISVLVFPSFHKILEQG